MFPLERKIKLAVAGVYQNGRKKGFYQPEKKLPLAGIRLFFINWISTSRSKIFKWINTVSTRQKVGFH